MRADAARRRAEIVRAARRLYAAHGGDVALESIAESAGVGIATLYRNFPSRAALADEVARAILQDVRDAARTALAGFDADPHGAWRGYVLRLVDLDLGALSAALSEHLTDELSDVVRAAQDAALAGVADVLAAARRAGLVRDDVEPLELVLGIGLVTRPLPETVARDVPHLVTRVVEVMLAGLRPA